MRAMSSAELEKLRSENLRLMAQCVRLRVENDSLKEVIQIISNHSPDPFDDDDFLLSLLNDEDVSAQRVCLESPTGRKDAGEKTARRKKMAQHDGPRKSKRHRRQQAI